MSTIYRRLTAWIAISALLLTSLLCLTPLGVSAELILTTDKTTYNEGEDILVTAVGSGSDWVGLYPAGDPVPGNGNPSVLWYYVARDGNTSGTAKNIRRAEYSASSRADYLSIPAGDYIIYLCANDGYNVLAQVKITVRPTDGSDAPPAAPSSAVYTSADLGAGRADGKLTVTRGEGLAPTSYIAYWANENGRLEGWSEATTFVCSGETTTVSLAANTLIPAGADRLLVYGLTRYAQSETCAVAMLPEGAADFDPGELLGELQVMSDIHINASDSHLHNQHFAAALEDIKTLSPNSMGLFINGDIADHGQAVEYSAYRQLLKRAGDGIPPTYAAMGNHDFNGGLNAAAQIRQFLDGTDNDSETVWFDRWINGYHFIFLSGEVAGGNAELSHTQLDWLDETLAKDRVEGRPSFVFLHQGLMNTVAGTFQYQNWHGVNQSAEMRRILKKYPEAVLFSGHSHWTFESEMTVKPADDELPTVVSTASCAYLWDDTCIATNVGITGSEGFYLYLYENYMILRGRSYDRGEWIGSAQFIVTLKEPGESTLPDTEPATEPVTEPATESVDEPVTETATDSATASEPLPESDIASAPATEAVATETPTDPASAPASDTAAATTATASDGCASVCGAAGILLLTCAAGVALCRKRRQA